MKALTIVTAHTSRLAAAEQLCANHDATMFLDDGTLGEPGNTRAALRWAETQDASHIIILQDDALPVEGFSDLARAAIAERPEHIISYYLGTGRPAQIKATRLIRQAQAKGSRWINLGRLYWGVAWSLPTAYLPDLNTWLAHHDGPTDTAVGHWSRFSHAPCTHAWPCLVDHADGTSLIHDRTERRKAWSLAQPPHATDTEPPSAEASPTVTSVTRPSTMTRTTLTR